MTDPALPSGFIEDDPPPPKGYSLTSGEGTPMASAMRRGPIDPRDDPMMMPGIAAQAVASLPHDSSARGKYLASQIFPDMSPDQAMSRMGIQGGRWFYIDKNGRAFFAEPDASLKNIGSYPATLIGEALPVAGSIAGGTLSSALGGVPGAALGASAGDAVRQLGASMLAGEDRSVGGRIAQNVGAAAEGAVGQGLGALANAGIGALVNRNPLGVAAEEAARLTPARIAQMQDVQQAAQGMGVQVTPGEAGNIGSLLARQRQLGRNDLTSSQVRDFIAARNSQQIPQAWDAVMGQLSPQSAPGLGARQLAEGAEGAIEGARTARRTASAPLYQSVMDPRNVIQDQQFASLMQRNPLAQTALQNVRNDPVLSQGLQGAPDQSLPALDLAKRRLDDMYDAAMRQGERNRARIIGQSRDQFLDALDEAFPGYAEARAAYAGRSPEVDALQGGIVGLASRDRANAWQQVPNLVFDRTSSDPMSIAHARAAYDRAGQIDSWNAGLRSYLDNLFSNYAKQSQGPSTGLVRNVWDDARQRQNLQAAMSPQQFTAMQSLMENVLRPISRAPAEGSPTATDLGASFAGGAVRNIAAGIKGLNIMDLPRALADHLEGRASNEGAMRMADLITQPDSVALLNRLRMMPAWSQPWIDAVGNLATMTGINAALPGPVDRMPSAP